MRKLKSAFSLIELSVAVVVIAIIIASTTQGVKLVKVANLTKARSATNSSPAAQTDGMILWLEATSTKSFNSTQPTDSSLIDTWKDLNPQSSNRKNAVQSTTLNKPRYVLNAINDLPGVKFDGVDDMMISSDTNIDYTISPNITFFAVYIMNATNVVQAVFGQDNGGWDRFLAPICCAGNGAAGGIGTGLSLAGTSISEFAIAGKKQIVSAVLQNNVTNGSTIYYNGSLRTTYTENHPNSGDSFLTIGRIGSGNPYYGNVTIGELIFYDRALTDVERQRIEQYLSKKWKIPLN